MDARTDMVDRRESRDACSGGTAGPLERAAGGPRILIAGLGNELLTDDGVGIHVVHRLAGSLPPDVIATEVGTAVLDALHLFEWADCVIAVDAVQAGHEPGTVYTFDMRAAGRAGGHVSLHELSIVGALRFVDEQLHPVAVHVVGVEPAVIDYGMELSPAVAAALPAAEAAVRDLVATFCSHARGASR